MLLTISPNQLYCSRLLCFHMCHFGYLEYLCIYPENSYAYVQHQLQYLCEIFPEKDGEAGVSILDRLN